MAQKGVQPGATLSLKAGRSQPVRRRGAVQVRRRTAIIPALDVGLAELYPPEQRFGPNLEAHHLEGGRGTFLLARDDGRAVGCGAIRLIDPATAEAKRMYVEPNRRGKGVGRAMLASLEVAAKQLGAWRLVLETGIYQDAALSFCRYAGFMRVDCWGEYASSPTSICLEEHLD